MRKFSKKCYTFAVEFNSLNMAERDLNRIKLVLVEKKRTGVWLAQVQKTERTVTAKTGHYKIFCVNGNTGFRNESRIFNFIHLQNEEEHERKESSSA